MPVQPPLCGLEDLFEPPSRTATSEIWDYPDVPADVLMANAKWLGLSGEHLVDSILLRFGLYTTPLPETLPADRMLFLPGGPLRVQIKTTSSLRVHGYSFCVSRGYHRAPSGVRPYEPSDFDLVALVVLPENVVKFSAEKRQSHTIAHREIPVLRAYPRRSLDHALTALGIPLPADAPETENIPSA